MNDTVRLSRERRRRERAVFMSDMAVTVWAKGEERQQAIERLTSP